MSRQGVVMVCAVTVALQSATTVCANTIWEWGGAGGGYLIDQGNKKVTITAPGTYKFAASEPNDPDNLGEIWLIEAPGVQGTVNIYVAQENYEPGYGVARLKQINLSGATVGNIVTVRARDSIADDGDVVATSINGHINTTFILHDIALDQLNGDIWCHEILANVTVAQSAAPSSEILALGNGYWGVMDIHGTLGYLALGDLMGTVTVHGSLLQMVSGSLTGELTVYGNADDVYFKGVEPTGSIVISGNLGNLSTLGGFYGHAHVGGDLGWLFISSPDYPVGEFGPSAVLTVDGNLTHWFHIYGGALAGTVTISGSATADSAIATPYGPLSGTLTLGSLAGAVYVGAGNGADLSGSLNILGDLAGTGLVSVAGDLTGMIALGDPANPAGQITSGSISIDGQIDDVSGDLSGGHINIYGSLTGAIESVGGFAGSTEYIAVDANGGDLQDGWVSPGYIKLGSTYYYGNTPGMRLWDVSDCRGDFNSDWVVDIADLNLWFTALSKPSEYALEYPGLGTSRVFHGDTNCDGVFNGYDRASFLDRLARHCCDVECPGCESEGRMASGSLAEELKAAIWPENYADLVGAVVDLAAEESQPQDQAYWEAVYQGLTE
jgi:hypothetical protein